MKLKEGKTYESKKGVKFKVLKIYESENKIRILSLKDSVMMKMRLDDVEKSLEEKEEPCGGK